MTWNLFDTEVQAHTHLYTHLEPLWKGRRRKYIGGYVIRERENSAKEANQKTKNFFLAGM